ncbi:MAG: hypothetical protein ACJ741_04575 [Pyrinomonadaceae bacterium]
MSLTKCPKCDFPCDPASACCEWCKEPLVASKYTAGLAPQLNSHVAGEGELPADFQFRRFESPGDALTPTATTYREHFLPLGQIVLVATLPVVVMQVALASAEVVSPWTAAALGSTASYLVNPLMAGALIHTVLSLLRTGKSPTLAESYRRGLGLWWRLLLCALLSAVIEMAGLLLLVVPGVIASLAFSVALPALAVENLGPVEAIRRSAELTQGSRILILMTFFLLWAIVAVVTWLTGASGAGHAGGSFFPMLVYAVVTEFLSSAFVVLSVFIYLGLRAEKDRATAAALAAGN